MAAIVLKRLVRRSLWLTCAYYLVDDWRAGRRLARGELETRSGRRHAALDLDQSLAYIDKVYEDYLGYAGLERFEGVAVEIGPGDNLGVALRMLADGAREVHAIDRYVPTRDEARQRKIYEALAARPKIGALLDGDPDIRKLRSLHYHPGVPAEQFFSDVAAHFDAVVSRAVLEHLYDPIAALDEMARTLEPRGVMVHRIDLRDHGMFAGRHPLTHLTIAPWLYRRMTRNSGRPNRVLWPAYRDWLEGSGLEGSVRVSRLAGIEGEIEPTPIEALDPDVKRRAIETVRAIRPHLAAPFRALGDDVLAVSGLVLVARKPAHQTTPSST